MSAKQLANFIDGSYCPPKTGKFIENINPATGKLISMIPDSGEEDIQDAVAAAQRASKSWAETLVSKRSALLNKVADLIEERLEEFALAESIDTGKPLSVAKMVDIPRACYNFRFYAGAIANHLEHSSRTDNLDIINYTESSPVGVCGLISPWNLPLYLLSWKIAPAIAVGNTCVCKPSEMTSTTAWMLGDILNKAGIPAGVCNIVFGTGQGAGAPLVSHPKVPLISFTGGTKTGEVISKLSAPFHKKLSLELGGKNPGIFFASANLKDAVATCVLSCFANQGEICLCTSRLFVQRSIYSEFLSAFVESIKAHKTGDPLENGTRMGALISEGHLNKVKSYIELAKEEGGKIECGGCPPDDLPESCKDGYFLLPTVISGLGYTSRVQQEEIFGPVVTIMPFDTEEEVIQYANSVEYGLAASLWTEEARQAHRVAHALEAGTVWVNCWLRRDLRMPFGGYKHSGVGREGGAYSLEFYTEQKTIAMKFT